MTRDNGSDRNGGDALAAPCGASQSGAEGNRPISTAITYPTNPNIWGDQWETMEAIRRGEFDDEPA